MKRKRIGLWFGIAIIVGGLGYLFYGGIGNNLVYFLTPTELAAKGVDAYDAPVRLGGQVVPGSVQWNAEALDLRFRMTDGQHEVPVKSKGAPPQMFRDGQGVVVEGRLSANGEVFEAKNLMVKHSNEYKAPHDMEKPAETYKSLIKEM